MKSFGFDLRALEVFVVAAQTGNMTLASSQLGLSQSSVSQILSQLEHNLGTKLLDRTVRPSELTVSGRYFFDQALFLLEQADKTQQAIARANFDSLHLVRIAMVDSLATTLGKPLIECIKEKTENWMMTTGHSHLHQQGLLTRKVDIIISDDALEDHENLQRFKLLKEPFVLVLPAEFRQQFPASHLRLQHLASRLDFIRYNIQTLIGKTIETYLRQQNIEAPIRMQLDNTYAVLSSVASGLGWTITTPLCLQQTHHLSNKLYCLPLSEQDACYRYLTLVTRRNELGQFPAMLAQDCRRIVRQQFLPKIRQTLPWAAENVVVGDGIHE